MSKNYEKVKNYYEKGLWERLLAAGLQKKSMRKLQE